MTRKIISLILKGITIVSVIVGATISALGSKSSILFFTTQSNIWIAVVCAVELVLFFLKKDQKPWLFTVKLIFTVSITLTGVVYNVMLAPFIESGAYTINSTLLHVVVPVASVADLFLSDYPADNKKWHPLLVTIPPFYYLAFAGIGFALNWDFLDGLNYPYYFLNWGSPAGAFGFSKESPYIGVVYYVLILLAIVIGIGLLFMWLTSLIRKKTVNKNSVE